MKNNVQGRLFPPRFEKAFLSERGNSRHHDRLSHTRSRARGRDENEGKESTALPHLHRGVSDMFPLRWKNVAISGSANSVTITARVARVQRVDVAAICRRTCCQGWVITRSTHDAHNNQIVLWGKGRKSQCKQQMAVYYVIVFPVFKLEAEIILFIG